jgi:hypothetical protein
VLAVALGEIAGCFATPAAAAIGGLSPTLAIRHSPSGLDQTCLVRVYGTVRTTQAEAQSLIATGHTILVRVWGDDLLFGDDLLLGPYRLGPTNPTALSVGNIAATPQGLSFRMAVDRINSHRLNEDGSITNSNDEVYAGVRLVDAHVRTIVSGETARTTGVNYGLDCFDQTVGAFIQGGP